MSKKYLLLAALFGVTLIATKAISGDHQNPAGAKPWGGMSLDQKVGSMPKGDVSRGQDVHNNMMCNSCHGVMGSSASRNYPSLKGQGEQYIVKMMLNYQQGPRWHGNNKTAPMVRLARSMDDQQIADLAAYMSDQKLQAWELAKPVDQAAIKNLVMAGDPNRGITGCASCHGVKGEGMATMPALAGQVPEFFKKATKAFRTAHGVEGANPMMRMIADGLTDEEIDALAAYYAALPLVAEAK